MLSPNRPNPFNPRTAIEYSLARESHVSLSVYDATGRLVRRLVESHRGPGTYVVEWDGRDHAGRAAASGVYFCRLVAGGISDTKKMMMIR